jgi:hypothetical protein
MTWWMVGVFSLGLSGSVGSVVDPPLQNDARSAWMTDYTAARRTARQSGKPIFVVFR